MVKPTGYPFSWPAPAVIASSFVAAALTVAAIVQPMLAAAMAAFFVLALFSGKTMQFSLVLLIAGPLLASGIKVGAYTLDNVLVAGGAALYIFTKLSRGQLPLCARSAYPALFAVAVTLSGLASGLPFAESAARYLSLALIPELVADLSSGGSHRFTLRTVDLCVAVGLASVLTQPFLKLIPPYVDPETGLSRFGGLFGHPNFSASVLSLWLLFSLGRTPGRRLLTIAARGLLLVGVLASGSLGAAATVLVIGLLSSARRIGSLAAVAVGTMVVVIAFGATLIERLSRYDLADPNNSLVWRLGRWGDSMALADWTSPFGIGPGGVEQTLGGPAHSAYVAILVELGWLGAGLVTIGMIWTLRSCVRNTVVVAATSFMLITSVTDPILYYPSTLTVFLVIISSESLALSRTRSSRAQALSATGTVYQLRQVSPGPDRAQAHTARANQTKLNGAM